MKEIGIYFKNKEQKVEVSIYKSKSRATTNSHKTLFSQSESAKLQHLDYRLFKIL